MTKKTTPIIYNPPKADETVTVDGQEIGPVTEPDDDGFYTVPETGEVVDVQRLGQLVETHRATAGRDFQRNGETERNYQEIVAESDKFPTVNKVH